MNLYGQLYSLLIVLLIFGCREECPDTINAGGVILLEEESLPIRDFSSSEAIAYVDEDNNEFQFFLKSSFEGVEKHILGYSVDCDDFADSFEPFIEREVIRKKYEGIDGSYFELSLVPVESGLVRSQEAAESNVLRHLRDEFRVELYFPGCDTIRAKGEITKFSGEVLLVTDSPFQYSKHGIVHTSTFGFRETNWPGDLHFSLGKGIIGVDFCGRDWIQKIE